MVLDSKETTICYRCPKCGKMIFSVVGVFALSGDLIKLKCDCGGSELTVTYTSDRKIRINVPCIICPNPHNFVLGSKNFFSDEVFRLPCSYSGLDICLIGKKDDVIEAAREADEEFLALLKESGIEDFESFITAKEADDENQSGDYPDPEMQSVVHFMLCELEDEENISCRCGHHGNYEFKFVGNRFDTVLIYCADCSASVSVPLQDTAAKEEFLRIESLKLT